MADSENSVEMEGLYQPPNELQKDAHVKSFDQYKEMYKKSVEEPEEFWKEIAKEFYWKSPPTGRFLEYNFDYTQGPISIKWMEGAKTNICYNVLDRNIERGLGDKIAFYWEGNDPNDHGKITYKELLQKVCKFANVLKAQGIKKGDRVAIYMPMIVELTIAMLACARIGAIHSIVFAGYSDLAVTQRLHSSNANIIILADGVWRGTKLLNLKQIVDEAIRLSGERSHKVSKCIVVRHLSPSDEEVIDGDGDGHDEPPAKRPYRKLKINWHSDRDVWWHDVMKDSSDISEPEWMDAEDPLFMLYTSGSTGKPKGVLHTVGGYMLFTATTFKYVFDYQPDDVYWCTADVGWITGHSYVCYGPLGNGATSIIFEGTPMYPDAGRLWEVVDKYKVTKFYTAPTAIRSLMKFGDSFVTKYSRKSLKILGTVGEPINPEAWLWYHKVVGNGKCAIVDTFWQTETGGHVITPLPGATATKPGSATFPFFGVVPAIVNDEGKELTGAAEGYLVFKQPWPSIMRTVYGDHERFETTYFKKFPGCYCTGDGARRDEDGYIWITGRIDDMVNVSGHLLSTAEVESALIEHKAVTEAASVSHPHKIKGECIYCFVTLKQGFEFTPDLTTELKNIVRAKIGPFAQPDFIQNAPALPKTRSGKIMRRILRKTAVGDRQLGDTSTLADESVIDLLFQNRPNDA
ncbi:acetyl-coenzyme A synthetase, cytoplasmic-like isoform X2 [Haliotis rubra]|uniref:acetyl-coenzyme A synthetase, cytoplasmic-like isoform X2 n=1 Tax=Haliotis rubra TaxID=36100 RepID=UPI001EE5307D|nr:acetyl-coenzyme A synthetase, cytoplasmic-like isoform X2 [Haliotis rubra]XP_046575920.1 acetyl-coenzyme A synthetase, cytoplasmic-like isoform X2 [Haliotis rubra]